MTEGPATTSAVNSVFISYRRSDTQMAAGRLREALSQSFGNDKIFRDRERLDPTVDWRAEIDRAITPTAAVLVLIGSRWLENDIGGRARIHELSDEHRLEITRAVSRGCSVFPVLVDGISVPKATVLPRLIRPIFRRTALCLRDSEWASDLAQIVGVLSRSGLPLEADQRPYDDPKKMVERWLAIIDAHDYNGAWEIASDDTRDSYDRESFLAVYETQRRPLGRVIKRALHGLQTAKALPDGRSGRFQQFLFSTMFENGSQMYESLLLGVERGGWRIFNHNLIPPERLRS